MSQIVDLHHHVLPDFYWEASNEDGNAAGDITPPRWSRDGAIGYLERGGDRYSGRIVIPNLGASSPQETALSTLAEVVAARHGHRGGRLAEGNGRIHDRQSRSPKRETGITIIR